jgi:hypothetical protein
MSAVVQPDGFELFGKEAIEYAYSAEYELRSSPKIHTILPNLLLPS